MNKPSFIKRYYVPGLISLILLPVCCLWYFKTHKAFEKLGVIEVTFWGKWFGAYEKKDFGFYQYPPRSYKEIILCGKKDQDALALEQSLIALRKLVEDNNDTISGIHYRLNSDATYETFIDVLNLMRQERRNQYSVIDNDIYVFNALAFPREKEETVELRAFGCGTGLINVHDLQQQRKDDANTEFMRGVGTKFWLPELLFVILCLGAILNLIKRKLV